MQSQQPLNLFDEFTKTNNTHCRSRLLSSRNFTTCSQHNNNINIPINYYYLTDVCLHFTAGKDDDGYNPRMRQRELNQLISSVCCLYECDCAYCDIVYCAIVIVVAVCCLSFAYQTKHTVSVVVVFGSFFNTLSFGICA